jgi:membrane associated rhomboid family serine protease
MSYPTDPRDMLPPPGHEHPPEPERPVEPPAPPVRQPWPPVCAAIIGGSVALFLLDVLLSGNLNGLLFGAQGPLYEWTALYGPYVQAGQVWRVLSTVFMHGGLLHLGFNMSVVYSLGMPLERGIGSGRFLMLSLVAALGSSTFALLFNFNTPTVGASGMILGWGGAMLLIATPEFRRNIVFWLVQVAVISLLPRVSWAGHLGGFLFGLPMGIALRSGPRVFMRAAPLLLAIAVAVVYIAAQRGTP